MSGEKLHRVTFSHAVAKRIADISGDAFKLIQVDLFPGRRLSPDERSNALYGVLSAKNGRILRVAIQHDVAQLISDDKFRYLCELRIAPVSQRQRSGL